MKSCFTCFNPLNPELNPIRYLLALLAHHFLHVNRIMVKSLTLRLLMSYIYGAPILDVSRSHLSRRGACGRSPAEILGSNPTGGMDICQLFHGTRAPCGPDPLHCRGLTITIRYTTLGRTSLDESLQTST